MSVLILILAAVLFVGLVVVHEWGHFIAARRGGVEVEEFGIGFPPAFYRKKVKTKRSKFDLTFNLLPLGGFVRLKGENDAATEPGSFGAAPLKTKIKIMLAGVGMNLLVAVVMLTILAAVGMPKLIDNQFTVASDTKVTREVENVAAKVIDNSPADRAGIKPGDRIVAINGKKIDRLGHVNELTEANAGKTVEVMIERNGRQIPVSVTLNKPNKERTYLGVESSTDRSLIQLQRSTWSAPIVGIGLTKQFTELTFKGLGTVIASLVKGEGKKASEQVSGPVGIAYILKAGSQIGLNFVLMIIAIISLSLAIMNILPIPALDGGRLFVLLLFRAIKKPLTKEREEMIQFIGFAAIMLLFVLITYVDIKRFF